jgi:N6-L-threonylcarbamoyladenine synthase
MFVLAIETSCDETSISLLESLDNLQEITQKNFLDKINSFKIIENLISSQIAKHSEFGGVVPEVGAREHLISIFKLFEQLKLKYPKIISQLDYIFVTSKPGLASALRVGVEFSKSLKFFLGEKARLVEINHLYGHIASCFYGKIVDKKIAIDIFPHLHLLVSGGNTQLIWIKKWGEFEIIGQTLDDAVGECLDKIGRMLNLKYPGGVNLAKIADLEDFNYYNLPIGMKNKNLDLSFSGLKTAVKYFLEKRLATENEFKFDQKLSRKKTYRPYLNKEFIKKTCVSVQSVAVSQLINKLNLAIQKFGPKTIGISGGVSANLLLRKKVGEAFEGKKVFYPEHFLTGDNAVMIALAGILDLKI